MSVLAGGGLLILMLLCVIGVEVLIGVMVYRDAKARGMEPWLWAAVCVLVPYFIGLIVYLVVRARNKGGLLCGNCGAPVEEAYACCPQCGAALKYTCDACGKHVEPQWKLCAYCGQPLPQNRQPLTQPTPSPSNKPIWIVLGVIVGLLVLFFVLIPVVMLAA